jgi:hypothetical protein
MQVTADRATLESQLYRSRVLATKDFTKWDWETIEDTLQVLSFTSRRLCLCR